MKSGCEERKLEDIMFFSCFLGIREGARWKQVVMVGNIARGEEQTYIILLSREQEILLIFEVLRAVI